MAEITKINVECSYLKSLPNYENIRFTAGVEINIGQNDDASKVYEEGWQIVGKEIENQLNLFSETDTSKIKKGLK